MSQLKLRKWMKIESKRGKRTGQYMLAGKNSVLLLHAHISGSTKSIRCLKDDPDFVSTYPLVIPVKHNHVGYWPLVKSKKRTLYIRVFQESK